MIRKLCVVVALIALAISTRASVQAEDTVPETPYHRYTTKDKFGRTITFYLAGAAPDHPVPLAVWIQGTGCDSLFERRGERIAVKAYALMNDASHGRTAILAVEKPGVQYLDAPEGDATHCRHEYRQEHTLERWSEAVAAAITAARELPGIDRAKTLVVGGSEGGVVAIRVSRLLPNVVTHAASLAGGGPNHLFILSEYMRRLKLDPEKEVYRCWAEIVRDPDSTTRYCWGQPHRLWSSLLKTSLIEECLQSKAELYLMHGTADEQSSIAAFDVMKADLTAKGRTAVFDLVEGGSHAMGLAGQDPAVGLQAAYGRVLDWFFNSGQ